jgi:hypothetical protein
MKCDARKLFGAALERITLGGGMAVSLWNSVL